MGIYQSTLNEAATDADIVEKVPNETGYKMYMCFSTNGDTTNSKIKLVEYSKTGEVEQYKTQYPNGSKDFKFDWEDRADLTYKLAR